MCYNLAQIYINSIIYQLTNCGPFLAVYVVLGYFVKKFFIWSSGVVYFINI